MNPPAPLMSSQMPTHPANKKDQEMYEDDALNEMMDS